MAAFWVLSSSQSRGEQGYKATFLDTVLLGQISHTMADVTDTEISDGM